MSNEYTQPELSGGLRGEAAPEVRLWGEMAALFPVRGDLGLLAGAYFFGFATTQLPLGTWLDKFGPKRVILSFLVVAVFGCVAFSAA